MGEHAGFQYHNRSPHPLFCERTAKVMEESQKSVV